MGTLGLRAKIKSVDHSSLVDQVEENLIDYLIDNNFKAGDALPKEIELASTLQVSRTVVRKLCLDSGWSAWWNQRKKRGRTDQSWPDGHSGEKPDPKIAGRGHSEEPVWIQVGARDWNGRPDHGQSLQKDIDELKEIVAIEPEATEDFKFNIDHEIRFHGKLYEITGNENMKNFKNYSCLYLRMYTKVTYLENRKLKTNMCLIQGSSISLKTGLQRCYAMGCEIILKINFRGCFNLISNLGFWG